MSLKQNIMMMELLQQDTNIWDLFARNEEYDLGLRDGFDRFPHYMSSHRNPFEPSVSEYLHERGYRIEFPGGQPFAVCLTHDINLVYRSALAKGYGTLKSLRMGDVRNGLQTATQIRSRKLPLHNFREIRPLRRNMMLSRVSTPPPRELGLFL